MQSELSDLGDVSGTQLNIPTTLISSGDTEKKPHTVEELPAGQKCVFNLLMKDTWETFGENPQLKCLIHKIQTNEKSIVSLTDRDHKAFRGHLSSTIAQS